MLNANSWLRGLNSLFAGTATTNLQRDPDDPYDPADDLPFTWKADEALRP